MKKLFFLIKHASWFTRIVALLALAAALVSIATVWAGSSTALDKPIADLPILTEYGLFEESDVKEIKAELGKASLNDVKGAVAKNVDDKEVVEMMETIFQVVSIYGTVIVVLLVLAAVFMKKGLMIFAFITALPYCLMFLGMSAITTVAIATVVYFVLMTIVNKKYKAYKRAN